MDIYTIIIAIASSLSDTMTRAHANAYYRGKTRGSAEAVASMLCISYSEARQLLADIVRTIRRCEAACKRDGYMAPHNAAVWAVEREAVRLITEALPDCEALA